LDDLAIAASSVEESLRHTRIAVDLFRSLGLLISEKKSEVKPSQQLLYLGLITCSRTMRLICPKGRRRSFLKSTKLLLSAAKTRQPVTVRDLARWLGKAQSLTDAVFHASRRTRSCLRAKNAALAAGASWDSPVLLDQHQMAELRWWLRQSDIWTGRGLSMRRHTCTIDTDASGYGWAGWLGDQSVGGWWNAWESKHLSINRKELLAIFLTLQSFEKSLEGQTCLVMSDNMTALSYLRRHGGRSKSLSLLAEQIFDWCQNRPQPIFLNCVHLPGKLNTRADRVSRYYEDRSEYKLDPAVFRSLDQRWGRHSVDLFASRHNRQCRRYFSRRRDPQAAASDALLQNWATERNPYAHPPFSLLSRVLAQVERQCVPEMTLVAPDWAASWLPDLRRLAVEPPVVLPHTATLIAPATPTPWKKSRPLWKTLAWRVSGLS
jgi:hypothetical protein